MWHAGTVRSIGVSNFNVDDLLEVGSMSAPCTSQRHAPCGRGKFGSIQRKQGATACVPPTCELPGGIQYTRKSHLTGIKFIGYSTLGSQWMIRGYTVNPVLSSPVIVRIAKDQHVSEAQVALRWALQNGQIVIPRSSKTTHIRNNFDLWTFSLSDHEMAAIDELDQQTP
eukprot:scaffold391141_cov50-Prasinocladus_malaysianus.AAC.1